jgi:hypothetical protein
MSCATEASSVVGFVNCTAFTVRMLALIAVDRTEQADGPLGLHAFGHAIG